ncbi:hypothetical protein DH2020_040977 [Rehmannia glutinosa]|uniref:Molybdate-anion transporter-like protein n=1 Tax=Rehmannia glutinosa TaxID=99300 RepID=A0ABR0URH2_REHGL
MEGSWAVIGEYEFAYYGFSKEQMLKSLCIGYAISLFFGSFLGMLSDLVGHKKLCLSFYMLHLFVSIWKIVTGNPTIWLASICLSLASSMFSFSFETLMIVEHDKLGQRQDSLHDMFWLMTFFESASFISSQVIGNYLIDGNVNKNITSIWNEAVVLALVAVIFVTRRWKENLQKAAFKDYCILFHKHVGSDKRIWLLSWAQTCTHFSIAAFWITWAPTVVSKLEHNTEISACVEQQLEHTLIINPLSLLEITADGREVSLGLIYPCLLGFKMLGSTGFPWLFHGPPALRIEEYLVHASIIMGLALTIVAYDYQEIEVLVTLFCLFHACMGLVLPSLARLRTMYVPNEVRGGMMSLSLMQANAAVLLFLILRGYYQCIENSTISAFAALGLFSAAGCMHMLKKCGKQSRYNL